MGCYISQSEADKEQATKEDVVSPEPETSSEPNVHTANGNPLLTDLQVDIITSTWPLFTENKSLIGIEVFTHVFQLEPRVKSAFNLGDVTTEIAVKTKKFTAHATSVINIIDKVCTNLDNLVACNYDCPITKELMLLGAKHATIVEFDLVYFNIITKCLHLTWERVLHEEYTEVVKTAWGTVFDFITGKIQDGFLVYLHARQTTHVDSQDSQKIDNG